MQDHKIEWERVRVLHAAAEEIEKELIDCDVWDGTGSYPIDHASCYWGGAAKMMLMDQADIIEAGIYEAEFRAKRKGKR